MTTREWFRQSRRALFERSIADALALHEFARLVTDRDFDLRCVELGQVLIIFTRDALDDRMALLREQFHAIAAEYHDVERQILALDANDYRARSILRSLTDGGPIRGDFQPYDIPFGQPPSSITH